MQPYLGSPYSSVAAVSPWTVSSWTVSPWTVSFETAPRMVGRLSLDSILLPSLEILGKVIITLLVALLVT